MGQRQTPYRRTFRKGAVHAASLLESDIRKAAEARGFAVSRLLTRWPEIAGLDIARIARPVEVSYARGGRGATLTILVAGADAPQAEMVKERLRERVNACYGYQAIGKIRITQTAAHGFHDAPAAFNHAPRRPAAASAVPADVKRAAADVGDSDLRAALETLGSNVLSRRSDRRETT